MLVSKSVQNVLELLSNSSVTKDDLAPNGPEPRARNPLLYVGLRLPRMVFSTTKFPAPFVNLQIAWCWAWYTNLDDRLNYNSILGFGCACRERSWGRGGNPLNNWNIWQIWVLLVHWLTCQKPDYQVNTVSLCYCKEEGCKQKRDLRIIRRYSRKSRGWKRMLWGDWIYMKPWTITN